MSAGGGGEGVTDVGGRGKGDCGWEKAVGC